MECLRLLDRAAREYERRLLAVADHQWAAPSVCEGWTVQQLATHVVRGNRVSVGLLGGMSFDDAVAHAVAPGFGADRWTDFRESVRAQRDAFAEPGALERSVRHVTGDMPAERLLNFRIGEFLIHGWDLASSTGGDLHMDDELSEVVWLVWRPLLAGDESDRFAHHARPPEDDDAPPWRRLLEMTGREP